MENRMRDLEQIQEREGGDRGRRLGSLALAVLSVVGLTFAMGVVVGKAAMPEDTEATPDPLAHLAASSKPKPEAAATAPRPAPKVNAADLTFPKTLMQEDRPEVLAALQAAALEQKTLEQALPAAPEAPSPVTAQAAHATVVMPEPEPEIEPEPLAEPPTLAATLPAAVAAGPAARSLPQSVQHDPLVAAALPREAPGARAPKGMEGKFVLQVISYDRRDQAEEFAEGLRARGHEAYVIAADIPDRGRFYRVRIGPFKSRGKAETYRNKFEQEELMHTFIVRKREE